MAVANPLLSRELKFNTKQVVIDYVLDMITTSEQMRVVGTESLSRNPHWRTLAEVRAFYERHDYVLVEETEVGLIYEKPLYGEVPKGRRKTRFDHLPTCIVCGGVRWKKSVYCKTHYREMKGQPQQQPKSGEWVSVDPPQLAPGPTDEEILAPAFLAQVESVTPDEKSNRKPGRLARTECPECGGLVFKRGLCQKHYSEKREEEYQRYSAPQRQCKSEGCTESRIKWEQFCARHLEELQTGNVGTSVGRRTSIPVKAVRRVKMTIEAAETDQSARFCSFCLTGKPLSAFDTSKDTKWGVLNFICRKCEAKKQRVK